jgi:2-polyprenyl-3-methyl-5-hydroxy-6-metoxy-1,4-benzoquinol methylase
VSEWRLYDPDNPPDYFTAKWHEGRTHAPHLDQPIHRDRMHLAAKLAGEAVAMGARHLVDLGCGDGGMLTLLAEYCRPCWGYDLMPANVHVARWERGVAAYLTDFVDDPVEWADIAVCTEVLEHLRHPHIMVRRIAQNCRWIVASSPADEDDVQHDAVHAWAFDQDGYRELMEQAGIRVVRHELATGGRTFQVILGECPAPS